MHPMSAAALLLIALSLPAAAQPVAPGAAFYTLVDLQTIFVQNQQYFAFDTEGSGSAQLNHVHITELDTTTGNFRGVIVNPTLPLGFTVPAQSVPVSGSITITNGSNAYFTIGNFYGITFAWGLTVPACQSVGVGFTGAVTFQGYEGSGKMHAVIAGFENANWAACGTGFATFNPVPMSGQLTK